MFAVILISSLASAGELNEDCEAAVDAADKIGSDMTKCDYSNVGLNGVIHRAIANKENKKPNAEVSVETNSKNVKATAEIVPAESAVIAEKKPFLQVVSAEFGTAQQLAKIRYELIQRASRECINGFVVEKERYLPLENKLLKLELIHSCL